MPITRIKPSVAIRLTTSKGKDSSITIKTIEKSILEATPRALLGVKNRILSRLDDYIQKHRARTQEEHEETWRYTARNNLYNAIAHSSRIDRPSSNRFSLSLGNKKFIKKHVPYYHIINYGGKISMDGAITKGGKTFFLGYFGRGEPPLKRYLAMKRNKQVFKYSLNNPYHEKKGVFAMIPKNRIPPMYYLNDMAKTFKTEMNRLAAFYRERIKRRARARAAYQ